MRREHPLKALLAASFLLVSCLTLLVGIEGHPSAPAQAFAKPSDLDVTYIEREPRFPVYIIGYDEGVPYVAASPENDKTWPDVGEAVTFNAHVVNKGEVAFSGFRYTWRFYTGDGPPLWESTGQYAAVVNPGDDVVVSQGWNWYEGMPGGPDHRTHRYPKLVLTITPNEPDERASNNVRDYYPLGKDIALSEPIVSTPSLSSGAVAAVVPEAAGVLLTSSFSLPQAARRTSATIAAPAQSNWNHLRRCIHLLLMLGSTGATIANRPRSDCDGAHFSALGAAGTSIPRILCESAGRAVRPFSLLT